MKFFKSLHQQKISNNSFFIAIGCFLLFLFLNYSFIYKLERKQDYKVEAFVTQEATPGIELRINPSTKNLEWHYTSDVAANDPWKILATASEIKGERGIIGPQGPAGEAGYNWIGKDGEDGKVICQ